MIHAPPIVETTRLVLASPTPADASSIFQRYASDPDVTRYLGWPTHRSVADTDGFLTFSAWQWEQRGAGPYLIWARSDGRLLGSTGLEVEAGGVASIGYVLARDAWGYGYATEALRAMVDVSADIGLVHLYALCHAAHAASQRVLAKCAFARDEGWTTSADFPNDSSDSAQPVFCYRRHL